MPVSRTGSIAFVHSPYSRGTGAAGLSALQGRRAHSHAAREAHAKVRRQRVLEYRAARTRTRADEDDSKACTTELQTDPAVFVPVGLLGSGRRDPFRSYARPLNSTEDFLLDYCKC